MNLTARLKKWAIDNRGVKATASDDEFRKAIGEAIADPESGLSADLLLKLSTSDSDADDEVSKRFMGLLEDLGSAVTDLKHAIESDDDDLNDDDDDDVAVAKAAKAKAAKAKAAKAAAIDDDIDDDDDDDDDDIDAVKKGKTMSKASASSLEKLFVRMHALQDDDDTNASGERSFDIRVKSAAEAYDNTKSALVFPTSGRKGGIHPMAGRPVMDFSETGQGRQIYAASDLDKAIAGAFAKFQIVSSQRKSRTLGFMVLPQHDKELLGYCMANMNWGGATDGGDFADIKDRRLTPFEQKALIDDAVSGGLEAAPIVFDNIVIQTPLLHGELYPLVNTIPLDRGRRIEGLATGTVTGSWGGVDDTAIDLFDTSAYVTAFDTTVHRWNGSIRIGLDFLSDTPIDFGQHVTTQYGERLLEDLDDVVAVGNGTTQPEGVMNKSGTTSVAFGGTTSLGNYESLRFGVVKAEHRGTVANSAVFCGTEESYQRARALPVGASDARRLGGTGAIGGVNDYGSYMWMGLPYKINESMANTQLFYAILARYRMYRRRGLTMRTSTEGDTLLRRNEMLVIAQARYGGQLERGAVAAVTTTAPA